jgi:hypothetical protein
LLIVMAGFLFGGVGHEGNRSRAADGPRELPLVPGAAPRDPAGRDLPALGDETAQPTDVLEVNQADLVDTELADLAPAEPAPLCGLP